MQMEREGTLVNGHIQAKPIRMNVASTSQPNPTGMPPTNSGAEMQQYAEAVSGQTSGEVAKPTSSSNTSLNPPQNLLLGGRMLPGGNPQALQMSQGSLSGVSMPARLQQQLDPHTTVQQQAQSQPQQPQQLQQPMTQQSLIQQQQQQQQQFQPRSQMMLNPNSLSHLNALGQNSTMQLGNHMVSKASTLQLQMLQPQQQQQQQQPQLAQMQRKIMMGLGGSVGMSNMGNNMVGLGGLANAMNMGGARGIGGTAMSAPMTPISNMGNMSQNIQATNFISQQLRAGKLTPQQANIMAHKLKMRTGMMGGPQSSIAGISGNRQMLPGSAGLSSMLGQNLNRPNMPLQRTPMGAVGPMGPPKLMPGMNLYMNQQQQQQMQLQQQQLQQLQQQQLQQQQQPQQLQQSQQPQQQQLQQPQLQLQLQQQQLQQPQLQQQQQQQLQQQQQQQMQLQQQQETNSPLQAVVSSPQVGSPSTMGIPQMNQQTQSQQPQQNPISPQQLNQRTPMSPQQLNQRTPMSPQISSGAIHPMSTGNPEGCPASPQLSSQTLGSVGSMTNSPMELQGVNKSNSAGNA